MADESTTTSTPTAQPKAPVIKKAKIKNDLFLDASWAQEMPGHAAKNFDLESTVPIHQDLKDAFAKLTKHMAVMADQVQWPKTIGDLEEMDLESFICRSFSIGGSGDNEGIVLTGSRSITLGNLNINTPFRKFVDTDYPFMGQLSAEIQQCIHEVEQYLFFGKKAPTMEQGTLDLPGEQLDEIIENGPAKGKKAGKKSAGKMKVVKKEDEDNL